MHAAIGASAPLGLVITQHATLLQGAVMSAVSAGYSLLPDVDSEHATANRALGGNIHKVVHRLCVLVYTETGTSGDIRSARRRTILKWRDPYHRTLTHTLAVCLVLGLVSYGLAATGSAAAAFVAALGVLLLWPLYGGTVSVVVCGAAAAAVGAAVLLNPWLLSLAVAGGYFTHLAGDACTKGGIPALWPIPIKGKRWWNIRVLGGLVASGSSRERGPAIGVAMMANAALVFLQF